MDLVPFNPDPDPGFRLDSDLDWGNFLAKLFFILKLCEDVLSFRRTCKLQREQPALQFN